MATGQAGSHSLELYELREGQGSRESYRVEHRTPKSGSTESKCEHVGKLERGPPSTQEKRPVDLCALPSSQG